MIRDPDTTLPTETEDKQTVLKAFDTLPVGSITVNIHSLVETDGTVLYAAELLLWTGEDESELPVCINTQVIGTHAFKVAYDAIHLALKIDGSVNGDIFVIDDNGDISKELTVEEIMEHFGDDSLKD